MELAAVAFRFALATIFVLAGLAKLGRLDEFEAAVRNYALLPPRLVRPVARALPVTELGAGALLAIGLATSFVAALLSVLVFLFAAAVSVNLVRGREIDCGCFGPVGERRIGWTTVARNVALVAMAVVVAVKVPTALAVDGMVAGGENAVSASDALALLVVATLAVFGLAIIGQMWRLRRHTSTISRVVGGAS